MRRKERSTRADRVRPRLALGALVVALGALARARGLAQGAGDADAAVVPLLRERLDRMRTEGPAVRAQAQVSARAALPEIYEEGGYRPLWTPERLETLLALVRESAEDGLRPEDYHLEELTRRTSSAGPGADPAARAETDLLATDAFFLLIYHLYLGKVDPKSLDPHWNFEPRPVGSQEGDRFVFQALTQGRLREAVERVRPDHWWYANARAALAEYRGLAARGGWPSVPAGPALKPGAKGPRILALRRRLAATGDLAGRSEAPDDDVFDAPLAAAVQAFQERHRLEHDGNVGAETLAELNVPVEARVLQIRINLERARWVLHEIKPGDLVIVDVAGFNTVFVRDGKPIWRSRTQVGKPFRQTPIFKAKIDHVVFNPTWTVPPGILAKDTLPAARKDPGYLERKGLDLIDKNGQKIDPTSVDWTSKSFPYTVRQEAGPDNALGRVKIMFPNSYHVYLHDTPSKALFEKEARAFSSGCMRVDRPLELVELLLADPQSWSASKIDAAVATGKTQTVRLRQPVPVLIMYWTIDPTVEKKTVFKRDPYGRDEALAQALDEAYVPARAAAAAGTR
ncbi:MAG TPA: L,D-transpeptidase family protein [Thermoanaerobaculia bacterium]